MPYYYGYDWTYVYLVLPCLIFSLWASWRVNSTFKKYSKQYSSRGLTGADAAQRVLPMACRGCVLSASAAASPTTMTPPAM